MKEILTSDGFKIEVDAADYERLNRYCWSMKRGYATSNPRTCIDGKRRNFLFHRLLLLPGEKFSFDRVIHHIDGNPLNNRRANLKVCTQAENMRGIQAKRKGSSKYRGTHWEPAKGKWTSAIRLGVFDTQEEAAQAWNDAQTKLFGDLGQLNKIESTTLPRVGVLVQNGTGTPVPIS